MQVTTRLAGGGVLALCLVSARPAPDELSHEEVASAWLERHGAAGVTPAEGAFGPLLERTSVVLSLGVFEVFLPVAALDDGASFDDARAALLALVEVQRGWADWVAGRPMDAKSRKKAGRGPHEEVVVDWLDALDRKRLRGEERAGATLLELAGAPEEVRAAVQAYRDEQRGGAPLGLANPLSPVRLAVYPRRAEFVAQVCAAGAVDPHLRPSAWSDGVDTWLEYRARDTRMVALEYGADGGHPSQPVSKRSRDALGQLVAQVGTRSFLADAHGERLDPALRSALANALVIDLYGELDTRIDGDVRARSSEGRSTFVPGGNPSGGTLPPTNADSRWRATQGKDHFVTILARMQKQGGKRQKKAGKLASFELTSDDGLAEGLVQAPFLGPNAAAPGAALFPDYLELVRCYGVAFVHWLHTECAGEESAARFAELLKSLGKSGDLPTLLRETYGEPLSAEDVDGLFDSPTLEGRFLAWLSKQR